MAERDVRKFVESGLGLGRSWNNFAERVAATSYLTTREHIGKDFADRHGKKLGKLISDKDLDQVVNGYYKNNMEKLECSQINEDVGVALKNWQRDPMNEAAMGLIGGYLKTADSFGLDLSFKIKNQEGIFAYNFGHKNENPTYRILPDQGLLKIMIIKTQKVIREFQPYQIVSIGVK